MTVKIKEKHLTKNSKAKIKKEKQRKEINLKRIIAIKEKNSEMAKSYRISDKFLVKYLSGIELMSVYCKNLGKL